QAEEAFSQIQKYDAIHLLGLHSHIGSQIFNSDSFVIATEIVFDLIKNWKERHNFVPSVVNVDGGFGIGYTESDDTISLENHVENIINKVKTMITDIQIPMPEIWFEPGRSIVGEAGISLYEIGATKEIPNIRKYVSVDGGMSDNIRPALYEANYDAIIANKGNAMNEQTVSIAGKCCESGDMLIWDLEVPHVNAGDILLMLSTGAYGYAMASNYNRLAKPAVVFVENGQDQLVIKRESLEDIIQNDLSYSNKHKEEHVK